MSGLLPWNWFRSTTTAATIPAAPLTSPLSPFAQLYTEAKKANELNNDARAQLLAATPAKIRAFMGTDLDKIEKKEDLLKKIKEAAVKLYDGLDKDMKNSIHYHVWDLKGRPQGDLDWGSRTCRPVGRYSPHDGFGQER